MQLFLLNLFSCSWIAQMFGKHNQTYIWYETIYTSMDDGMNVYDIKVL